MRLCPAPLMAALIASLIAGCTPFPKLEESAGARAAPYPDLVPVKDIVAQVPPEPTDPESTTDLADRSARLKARAARLKGSVVDADTQERLESGVNSQNPRDNHPKPRCMAPANPLHRASRPFQ